MLKTYQETNKIIYFLCPMFPIYLENDLNQAKEPSKRDDVISFLHPTILEDKILWNTSVTLTSPLSWALIKVF